MPFKYLYYVALKEQNEIRSASIESNTKNRKQEQYDKDDSANQNQQQGC